MKILFSTWPAHGHILPLLPMVRAAQRAGHDVVVASGAEGAAEAARRGIAVWDVGPSRADCDAAFRARHLDLGSVPPAQRMATVIAGMFGAGAARRAAGLVARAEAWGPDVVIHPITELAGAVAAARTGARHVVHGLGPLPAEAWAWFGAGFEELCRRWDVPELAERIVSVPYLDNCPSVLQVDAVADFGHRRPLRPTSGEVLPGEQLPWSSDELAALPHDRTVHLTLGTLFHGATDVFRTALAGLGELPVNVVVALGPGADLDALGPQPAHVLVTDFAPHALLLAHCDLLVTQGGAGTIVAALVHGLPHLILPQGADQFHNADTAEAAGVARRLVPAEATAPAITALVAEMLGDAELHRRTDAARVQIAAMPPADDVLAALTAPVPA